MIDLLIWALAISGLAYLLLTLVVTSGWFRLKTFEEQQYTSRITVSVVVALRNEEKNIRNLLQHLHEQDYPKERLEIILVDDHSEDQTKILIGKFRNENRVRNIILEKSPGKGKKAAIAAGVRLAGGELIITTDADCEMASNWISRIVDYYLQYQPRLIVGPVVHHRETGILQKLFSLEFASLVASGAGSIGANRPFMGNGANLAINRQVFNEAVGSMPGQEFASGDDVFLIQYVLRKYGAKSIHFIKDQNVLVKTLSPGNTGQFLAQRIRWASKAKGYRNFWPVMVSFVVALFNLMLVTTFAAGIIIPWFFFIYILYILLKFLIDMPLLFDFLGFCDKRGLRKYLLLFELFYPFYIVAAAFLSLFVRYEWKGRKDLR